ncbi:hypothetical protein [Luteimonas sp. A478]
MQVSFRPTGHTAAARLLFPAASAAALALMLAGCGGDGASAAGGGGQGGSASATAKFDPSLRDTPCSVITADTMATVFGLPVDEIDQHAAMGMCLYEWKSDGQVMDATIHVSRVSENAADAAKYFASATAGMSGAEVDEAMDSLREQIRENDGAGRTGDDGAAAAEVLLGAAGGSSSSGIRFRDVSGVGDQARMQVGTGDLNVLYGNLQFSVTAYHGESMPFPDDFSGAAGLMAASNAWMAEILPQREEQTIELARAALSAL